MLSAILWLGNLKFRDTENEACELLPEDKLVVKKIATLLGVSEAHIFKVCTTRQITVKGTITDIALKYQEVRIKAGMWLVLLHYFDCRQEKTDMPWPKLFTPEHSPGWFNRSILAPIRALN